MRLPPRFYRRLRALILKDRIERDIDEELRLHLEMRTEDNIASGMPPADAQRDAARRFGNLDRIKEYSRDIRGGGFVEILLKDIQYGVRMMVKNPGFTLAAVLTLALGIGANSAIFSWLKALAIDYMPGVEAPHQLVAMPGMNADRSGCCTGVSYPNFVDYLNRNQVLDGILGYEFINVNLRTQAESMRVQATIVTGNYFDVLGVKPFLGRGFLPEETQTPGTHAVAVISHRMWQGVFGGDTGIVGRDVSINGHPFKLVGVTPPEFGSAMVGLAFDLFIPVTMQQVVAPGSNIIANRGSMWLDLMGRLKPGVSVEQARAGILAVSRQIETEHPEIGKDRTLGVFPLLQSPMGIQSEMVSVISILMVVAGLVLLIACANVAGLLLARASVRQKETAVRLALGAGRARLVRQLLTESLILAVAAGLLGLIVGAWTLRGMMTLIPEMDLPISFNIGMDSTVLGFTFGLALLTGLIFGFAPAIRLSKTGAAQTLKESGRSQTARSRLRTGLVVAQVAFSVVALICAGLFLRSLQRAYDVDLGFNPENVLMVSLDVFRNGYSPERGRLFYSRLLEDVRATPG
ncbi:MAG: ABC transporter permease, partial [Acidobacteria bacterium]|nr:ABC transporter permease [Acidobacteriota bacterium]